eukprot:COSAG01_NODE_9685_length_2370_cov_5.177015_1_plen_86_part_00
MPASRLTDTALDISAAPHQWSGNGNDTGNSGHPWMAVPPALEAANPLPDNQTADHAVETLRHLEVSQTAALMMRRARHVPGTAPQ